MTKLNDTQRILLSTASQRDDGSLYPLPPSLSNIANRITKAVAALLKASFAEERETSDTATIHRQNGDICYGLFITASGAAAIGACADDADRNLAALPPQAPARTSKSAAVIALLQRANGATLGELIAATSWLPHTTRAALTGLRKKGHAIERLKRDDQTCYRIVTTG